MLSWKPPRVTKKTNTLAVQMGNPKLAIGALDHQQERVELDDAIFRMR